MSVNTTQNGYVHVCSRYVLQVRIREHEVVGRFGGYMETIHYDVSTILDLRRTVQGAVDLELPPPWENCHYGCCIFAAAIVRTNTYIHGDLPCKRYESKYILFDSYGDYMLITRFSTLHGQCFIIQT